MTFAIANLCFACAAACIWAACQKIKRDRLRRLRAEAERTHVYYDWLRSTRST